MNDTIKTDTPETTADSPTPDIGNKRGQERPLTPEEQLEVGVEDSMDGSDPPSVVAPGDDGEPHPSSGFNEAEEKARQRDVADRE